MDQKIKIVGRRTPPETPAECHARSWRLEREIRVLNPWPRPRGFVFKAKSWAEYEAWRAAQDNPRLW